MIGSLRGTVLESGPEVIVEVSGIGYRVMVTPATAATLPPGSEVLLHIHHHRREDVEALYGFTSAHERAAFSILLGTHGVGPALALAVLATHTPDQLTRIVGSGDVGALKMVPGVGAKTAERLLIELRSRWSIPESAGTGPASTSVPATVRDALAGLGYSTDEIRTALTQIDDVDDSDPAVLLRRALAVLGAGRA